MRKWLSACLALLCLPAALSYGRERIDLGGQWRFAIDPLRRGEQYGWQQPDFNPTEWTEVVVPHCWPVDPRFPYTGQAWYRRTFPVQTSIPNPHALLVFHGVFYRTRVWMNGRLLGEHEGGYTPFTLDATAAMQWRSQNTLVLAVDNSWSTTTLPGARIGPAVRFQVYPWWDYGGIVRPVELLITGPVYTAKQRVVAVPDLAAGTATLKFTTFLTNAGADDVKVRLALEVLRGGASVATAAPLIKDAELPARASSTIDIETRLDRKDVQLWDLDHPNLYSVRSRVSTVPESGSPADEAETSVFGIRTIQIRGEQMLLNGQPFRMGGGNRHVDHPRYGSIEPGELVDADMRQMKSANMEFSRIIHYPVSEPMLDWADRNGHLIIEEGPNWSLTVEQMDSSEIRAKFQAQVREMLERDWNHPSILGWSVGNEYPSDTPSGVRWTRDMMAFVRGIDPNRLVTFASYRSFLKLEKPSDEASEFVDFPSVNLYGDPDSIAARLDLLRQRWPGRPIFISEFGGQSTTFRTEEDREEYFRRVIQVFRSRPFVVGASVWTYADYRSRWPVGTGPDGLRHFGLVTVNREPRGSYGVVASEFSPALVSNVQAKVNQQGGTVSCTVAARPDFPSYTLRGYTVDATLLDSAGKTIATSRRPVPTLNPGQRADAEWRFGRTQAVPAAVRIDVVRPTGIPMLSTTGRTAAP